MIPVVAEMKEVDMEVVFLLFNHLRSLRRAYSEFRKYRTLKR